MTFTESEIAIAAGDALVLYTDGVTEAIDAARAPLGVDGLAGIVQGAPPDAAGLVAEIAAGVGRFAADVGQRDDVTAVVVARRLP